MHALRERRESGAGRETASSKHSSSRDYHSNLSAHSRYYNNVSYILAEHGADRRSHFGAIYFAPSPRRDIVPSRKEWWMLRRRFYAKTYETRGAPLRSSASDVGHFIRHFPPLPSLPFPPPLIPVLDKTRSRHGVSVSISYAREG